MSKWHGGKGSTPRKVDSNKFANNWDAIFNKDKTKPKNTPEEKDNGTTKKV